MLQLKAVRPTAFGFEEHLAMLHRLLDESHPQLVVLDAVASLTHAGARSQTTSAIYRDLDLLKGRGITTVMTTLTQGLSHESDQGADLLDVYVGPNGVLTGSERVEQVSWERLAQATRADETERRRIELVQRSAAFEAQIAALKAQLTAETAEFERFIASEAEGRASGVAVRASQGRARSGDQDIAPTRASHDN